MAAPARGLSSTDLALIRDTLASGRKPRVIFTEAAGQVAGKVGQVVELTDANVSDEWIVVRFGGDELPFSPVDLAIPPKSPPAKRAEPKPAPPLRLTEPPAPAPRAQTLNGTASGTSTTDTATSGIATNGKPARVSRPKPPASLTVTLAYTDREWTVAASQGTKTLAKPYVIKPTEALQMVALVDVPGVHDAVENIIAAERAEAERRALRLREELAEIESRLAELTGRA